MIARATGPENEPPVVAVTRSVAVLPCTTKTFAAAALAVRLADAVMARLLVVVAEAAPLVPVIVMLPVPTTAARFTETVTMELVPGFTLAGLKLTVTPLGAVAFRATGRVYPLAVETATANVAVLP